MNQFNMKSIRAKFKDNGIFYTPPELAMRVMSYIDFTPTRVYDPTCGDGSLLSVFPDEIKKYGQEINQDQLDVAKDRLKSFTGYCGDTLTDDGFHGEKFDCIVANPPFSIKWSGVTSCDERFDALPCLPPQSKADFAFIAHIIHHLSDDGVAVIVCYPGVLYRGGREGRIRDWLINKRIISNVISIPQNTFVDTKIQTCIIVIDKREKHETIRFEDLSSGRTAFVSVSDIIACGGNLSTNHHIIEDQRVEVVTIDDEIMMEAASRRESIQQLRSNIMISKAICDLRGFEFSGYISDIEKMLAEFK